MFKAGSPVSCLVPDITIPEYRSRYKYDSHGLALELRRLLSTCGVGCRIITFQNVGNGVNVWNDIEARYLHTTSYSVLQAGSIILDLLCYDTLVDKDDYMIRFKRHSPAAQVSYEK